MSKKGFTLLELLIAMAILSLITLIVGSSLGLGIRAWDKGEADIDNSQRLRFFSERLSQQIKSAYPYQIEIDGKKVVAFQGKSDSIWFVTPSDAGLKWVSYFVKDDALMLREGIIPDKKVLEKISVEGDVLDSKVSALKFEYFSSEEKEWKESWDSDKTLPGAVRVRVDKFQPFVMSIPSGLKDYEKK